MSFPKTRLRRLRKSANVRRLIKNISLSKDDLLYPIFVKEGIKEKSEIKSMPRQWHHSLETLNEVINDCESAGIPGVIVFGIPENKNDRGSEAFNDQGIVQTAVSRIKSESGLAVFTDVCLCQYTTHGHCGILDESGLNNDKTLEVLRKTSVSHARAGADFVSPSGMIDGQVKEIREALDDEGFGGVGIMSYSAKFASNFYGPFRDAVESSPKKVEGLPHLGDRSTYQMDFKTREQPMREIKLDVEEGADIVMVKPALPYLDVIREARQTFDVPISAYQVSGEYSMIKRLSENDEDYEKKLFLESLNSIKRAGANFIITYGALDVSRWLSET
ncbi:delta-aminolevulinic acid dehydratase [candidate division MSBL1 archaeon SCGC-AAA261F19]|uniref:Delta-aminolevulinic acid dehydratase n=1 Tax=candidate division MSBL1 archaeon SCGC-AAA261F19 TaxID=1698275 RepID=A0A133V9G0_9EURY|nr:delta-aminolevulinic acid dehydratase [candidate division MSBL1 archaeon SCGC-AAA261F19]